MVILDSAAEIGVKQAAELAGVHYTSVYDWRRQLKSLGKQVFLDYKPSYPGRGVKQITSEQEKAVLDAWNENPGFGPGQVRNQFHCQAITISIRTILSIMQVNGYKATKRKSDRKNWGNMGTFVQYVHSFLMRSSTSGFCPDATNRVTQELVTPKYRATSAPE
jgi:transposase